MMLSLIYKIFYKHFNIELQRLHQLGKLHSFKTYLRLTNIKIQT